MSEDDRRIQAAVAYAIDGTRQIVEEEFKKVMEQMANDLAEKAKIAVNQAVLTERAAIVAWLRKQDGHGYDDMRADLIEAGEHHDRG